MEFAVLEGDSQDDLGTWRAIWAASRPKEVFTHPGYSTLFQGSFEKSVCAVWNGNDGTILLPLILRPIAQEPWAKGMRGLDATSPYGYGGPYKSGVLSSEEIRLFWKSFQGWATEAGVVTAFSRLSLFENQRPQILLGREIEVQPNVVRNLEMDEESLLRSYEHKVRKNVKRALSSGVEVEFDRGLDRLDDFLRVYHSTMDRRSARRGYYFDRPFFTKLHNDLPEQFIFAFALSSEGKVISAEVVLLSDNTTYSFLGGTLSNYFNLRPNDLLKHRIAIWARDEGRANYVLGGGYEKDDGIYRYKKSFAPQGATPFSIWRSVLNQSAYDSAAEARTRFEEGVEGSSWSRNTHFFPPYRAPGTE